MIMSSFGCIPLQFQNRSKSAIKINLERRKPRAQPLIILNLFGQAAGCGRGKHARLADMKEVGLNLMSELLSVAWRLLLLYSAISNRALCFSDALLNTYKSTNTHVIRSHYFRSSERKSVGL